MSHLYNKIFHAVPRCSYLSTNMRDYKNKTYHSAVTHTGTVECLYLNMILIIISWTIMSQRATSEQKETLTSEKSFGNFSVQNYLPAPPQSFKKHEHFTGKNVPINCAAAEKNLKSNTFPFSFLHSQSIIASSCSVTSEMRANTCNATCQNYIL